MRANSAFRQALFALSHPVSILGIIIVLLNDHWWRHVAPSWFTGKIGDFAWLIFAPFLLAAILAWLFPRREMFVGCVAIMSVGLTFGFAKTVPAFHASTIAVLEFLTGWPNVLRMDPTDLIALPALAIAWWIWGRSAASSLHWPNRGWVLLPLAVLATMANSGMPVRGIYCLRQAGNEIMATDAFQSFASRDGGLSWTEGTQELSSPECNQNPLVFQSNDLVVSFRFTPDGHIERSENSGQTWQAEPVVAAMPDAQATYLVRNWSAYGHAGYTVPSFSDNPLNAVVDATTGNLIIAAGFQGVLVRTLQGEWHTIGVGQYRPIDLRQPDKIVSLLADEILLALAVFALTVGTIAPGSSSRKVRLLLGLGWLVVCGALGIKINFLQGNYSHLGSQLSVCAAIVAGVIAVPVMAIRLRAAFRLSPSAVGSTIGLSVFTVLLFLLPFVVWTQNGIAYYVGAVLFACLLVAAMCFAGHRYLRRYSDVPKALVTT